MKKQVRLLILLLSLFIGGFNCVSQNFSNLVDSAFLKLEQQPPMEKLYLHLDRPSYSSGSTIWFKGYLLTATGHAPFAWSKFIYVELFDKTESLVTRKKIKQLKKGKKKIFIMLTFRQKSASKVFGLGSLRQS